MKSFASWLFVGSFLLVITGCNQEFEETPAETSRPVPILQLSATGQEDSLRFPGRVRASTRAELAFKVSGQIINLPVKEGQKVEQGDLIAQLDDSNYKNLMQASLAKYNKAKSDYQRAKELMQLSQAVSKAEVEKQQATMQVAEAEYALTKQDFDDTKLVAPFVGVVTKRHVEYGYDHVN